jgi:hypothetical protein
MEESQRAKMLDYAIRAFMNVFEAKIFQVGSTRWRRRACALTLWPYSPIERVQLVERVPVSLDADWNIVIDYDRIVV